MPLLSGGDENDQTNISGVDLLSPKQTQAESAAFGGLVRDVSGKPVVGVDLWIAAELFDDSSADRRDLVDGQVHNQESAWYLHTVSGSDGSFSFEVSPGRNEAAAGTNSDEKSGEPTETEFSSDQLATVWIHCEGNIQVVEFSPLNHITDATRFKRKIEADRR